MEEPVEEPSEALPGPPLLLQCVVDRPLHGDVMGRHTYECAYALLCLRLHGITSRRPTMLRPSVVSATAFVRCAVSRKAGSRPVDARSTRAIDALRADCSVRDARSHLLCWSLGRARTRAPNRTKVARAPGIGANTAQLVASKSPQLSCEVQPWNPCNVDRGKGKHARTDPGSPSTRPRRTAGRLMDSRGF